MVAWDKMVLSHGMPKPPKPETPMPALFNDTDPERIGAPLSQYALGWTPSGKGLLIHGSTRKGKTRTAWYIANRLWNSNNFKNKYLFLTMFELEARIASSWGNSSWDKTMFQMTNVPLLFLDDLGKEKMTDRMASCLFALIDQRTMHQRPTIITTNLTGDTLLERFHDKETGTAFVARLKDPDLFDRVAAK
jgi:DNA replication protein DnaC